MLSSGISSSVPCHCDGACHLSFAERLSNLPKLWHTRPIQQSALLTMLPTASGLPSEANHFEMLQSNLQSPHSPPLTCLVPASVSMNGRFSGDSKLWSNLISCFLDEPGSKTLDRFRSHLRVMVLVYGSPNFIARPSLLTYIQLSMCEDWCEWGMYQREWFSFTRN